MIKLNNACKAKIASDRLEKLFGVPKLPAEVDPLDCLILTILSQNTNDINRDRAFAKLKNRFHRWEELLEAELDELRSVIKIAGLGTQKSQAIKNFLLQLKTDRGNLALNFICQMPIDEAINFLVSHKGIGIKTASVTLGFACGHEVFPVDTHILRISKRLGFVPEKCTAEKAHQILPSIVPKGKSFPFHINLIEFGRKICNARKPKCGECPIADLCLFIRK